MSFTKAWKGLLYVPLITGSLIVLITRTRPVSDAIIEQGRLLGLSDIYLIPIPITDLLLFVQLW